MSRHLLAIIIPAILTGATIFITVAVLGNRDDPNGVHGFRWGAALAIFASIIVALTGASIVMTIL